MDNFLVLMLQFSVNTLFSSYKDCILFVEHFFQIHLDILDSFLVRENKDIFSH